MEDEEKVQENTEINSEKNVQHEKIAEENPEQVIKKTANEITEESDEESVLSEDEGHFSPEDDESVASTIDADEIIETDESTGESDAEENKNSELARWYKNFLRAIKKSLKTKTNLKLLEPDELIQHVLMDLCKNEETKIIPLPETTTKSSSIAEAYRVNGFYHAGCEDIASLSIYHRECTKSMAHAPAQSLQLALAYSARSTILLESKLITDCLNDINHALAIKKCPEITKAKLYFQKTNCLKILQKKKFLIDRTIYKNEKLLCKLFNSNKNCPYASLVREKIDEENSKKDGPESNVYWKKSGKLFCDMQDTNQNSSGLSDKIALNYNDNSGRHVVAVENIPPGSTLMVKKPYAAVLYPEVRWEFCWHCKNQIWSSVPCESCTVVIFCTEQCRVDAMASYHDTECLVLQDILNYGMGIDAQLALQIAATGWKECNGSFSNLWNVFIAVNDESPSVCKGFEEQGKVDFDKFKGICSLSTSFHIDSSISPDVLRNSIIIAYLLVTKTKFLELPQEDIELQNDQDFICLIEFLATIIHITRSNGFTQTLYRMWYDEEPVFYGIVIPYSFFNHSCVKKTVRVFSNGYVALKLLDIVYKNEEIFVNYTPDYTTERRKKRRKQLFLKYRFKCRCEACVEKWPRKSVKSNLPAGYEDCLMKLGRVERDVCRLEDQHFHVLYRNVNYRHDDEDFLKKLRNAIVCMEYFSRTFDKREWIVVKARNNIEKFMHMQGMNYMFLKQFEFASSPFFAF